MIVLLRHNDDQGQDHAHIGLGVEVGGVRVRAASDLLPRADDGVVQPPQARQVLVT